MSTKCRVRVWWPKELSSQSSSSSSSSLLLFGWFVSCSPVCLDVVVAFAYDEDAFLSLHSSEPTIEVAIQRTNEEMPIMLQDKSRLTVLGRCVVALENVDDMCKFCVINSEHRQNFKGDEVLSLDNHRSSLGSCGKWSHSFPNSTWIQLVNDPHNFSTNEVNWVPSLHHLQWNEKIFSEAELHVFIILQ